MIARLAIVFSIALPAFGTWGNGYTYKATFTVNSGKVTGTLAGFTAVDARTLGDFATVANGGKIQNTCSQALDGLTIPADLLFTSDAAGSVALKYAFDTYSATTGAFSLHVGTFSIADGTIIYAWYGNSSVVTCQGGSAASVWDANTVSAYVLPNHSGSLGFADYTGNSSPAGINSPQPTSGLNAGMGAFLSGSSQAINMGNAAAFALSTSMSVEIWGNATNLVTSPYRRLVSKLDGGAANGYEIMMSVTTDHSSAFAAQMFKTNAQQNLYSSVATLAGTLYQVGFSYDNVTAKIYVNGTLDTLSGANMVGANSTTNLNLGRFSGAGNSYFNGSLGEFVLSNTPRSTAWFGARYNNVSSPSTFWTVSSGLTRTVSSQPSYAQVGTTRLLTLTGTGTTWLSQVAAGLFTVAGGTGASLATPTILSDTQATVTLTVGSADAPLTITDTSTSQTTVLYAIYPAIVGSWGGPWSLNGQGGVNSSGDTWLLTKKSGTGYSGTWNDGSGKATSGCDSNTGFVSWNSDLTVLTAVNCMSGLGTNGQVSIGDCGSGQSVKSFGILEIQGLTFLWIYCQRLSDGFSQVPKLLVSGDAGAHWARAKEDSHAVTGTSTCSAGTATLTTSQTLSVGNSVVVSNTGVVANGEYVAASGTNSTTLVLAGATCATASASGGSIVGPATVNVTPPTSGMLTSGTMFFAQYTAGDATTCSPVIDSCDTYVNGLGYSLNGATDFTWLAWRVLRTDLLNTPGDATKYQWWDGSTWGSSIPSAGNITLLGTDTLAAGQICSLRSVFFQGDAALPNGGQYFATCLVDGLTTVLGYATHIYGPYRVIAPRWEDTSFSPPVFYNFPGTAVGLYSAVSSSPYAARLEVQAGGGAGTNQYRPSHWYVQLAQASATEDPLLNTSYVPRQIPAVRHIQNGLIASWDMRGSAVPETTTLLDDTGNTPVPSTGVTNSQRQFFSYGLDGWWGPDPSLTGWGNGGGALALNTGFGLAGNVGNALGDFSALIIAESDLTNLPQVIVGGPTDSSAGFTLQIITGPHVQFSVRNAASISFNCPDPPAAGTYFAYLVVRKGATGYCFLKGTAAPTSGGSDSASLGTYNLTFAGNATGTAHYFRGRIGGVHIWNRALCSNAGGVAALNCSAGTADEVLQEFSKLSIESAARQWGF